LSGGLHLWYAVHGGELLLDRGLCGGRLSRLRRHLGRSGLLYHLRGGGRSLDGNWLRGHCRELLLLSDRSHDLLYRLVLTGLRWHRGGSLHLHGLRLRCDDDCLLWESLDRLW
jgi:hypothetical protein